MTSSHRVLRSPAVSPAVSCSFQAQHVQLCRRDDANRLLDAKRNAGGRTLNVNQRICVRAPPAVNSSSQMFAAVHRPESLFPRLKPTPLPPARRLPQERLLQLLLEARDAVVDRRPFVQEREVPYQAVLCLTYRSSRDAPGPTTAETSASRRRRSCAS